MSVDNQVVPTEERRSSRVFTIAVKDTDGEWITMNCLELNIPTGLSVLPHDHADMLKVVVQEARREG
jgi:hypothetical protein